MKLYKAPCESLVRLYADGTKTTYNYHHVDGAYSYCNDAAGNVVHLPAWAEVEVIRPLTAEEKDR